MAAMLRNITVTARGGHSLKDVNYSGANDPYLVLELDGQRVETSVAKQGGENPMWNNQTFKFVLPMEKAGETPTLRVSVMNSNRLLPDREIGSGSVALTSLRRGEGSEEVQIPITDKKGASAGVVMVAVQMDLGEQASLGSAAGSTLGTVHVAVADVAETALPQASQDALKEARTEEATPLSTGMSSITTASAVGPTAGVGSGQVMNPSSAAYGTMF